MNVRIRNAQGASLSRLKKEINGVTWKNDLDAEYRARGYIAVMAQEPQSLSVID